MNKSTLEAEFDRIWIEVMAGAPVKKGALKMVEEYPFAKEVGRRFRFDRAHMDSRVAVEVMGGTWTGGRHVRGSGYRRDCIKLLHAAELQWQVIYLTSDMVTRPYLDRIASLIMARNLIEGPNHDWIITHTLDQREPQS